MSFWLARCLYPRWSQWIAMWISHPFQLSLSYSAPSSTCVIQPLCCHATTSVVWLHFPYLSLPSFLHGSLNSTIASLPVNQRDSQKPEGSGTHLSSPARRKLEWSAFYISLLCKELKTMCARRYYLCLQSCKQCAISIRVVFVKKSHISPFLFTDVERMGLRGQEAGKQLGADEEMIKATVMWELRYFSKMSL